jgi:hypothetical protein
MYELVITNRKSFKEAVKAIARTALMVAGGQEGGVFLAQDINKGVRG